MNKLLLFFLSLCMLLLMGCKKEIGKKEYILNFKFESGGEISLTGKIFEKNKKNKKYQDQIDMPFSMEKIEKVGLYLDFKYDNTTVALKTPDQKIIVNAAWEFWNEFPPVSLGNQSGKFTGDMYMEGSYTQKGRAYLVEDGNFEFYWKNAADYGMTDTILKGTWSLKRK